MAAIELGTPYFIYTPSLGTYFALNAPADANFVGYTDDITGLDSPGIRENAQVVNSGDGGYHGPFWKDRRPWTMSGPIMPQFPVSSRDAAQEKIEGILAASTQADGYLTWTPADTIQRLLAFRYQQPARMTTGQSKAQKNFSFACVSADYRIVSNSLLVTGPTTGAFPTNLVCQNLGNTAASPVFKITGPWTSPLVITNTTTGKKLTLNASCAAGHFIGIDLTGVYPTVLTDLGVDLYGSIDPLNTDWSIAVESNLVVAGGNNTFQVAASGSSGASAAQVAWRHSWV